MWRYEEWTLENAGTHRGNANHRVEVTRKIAPLTHSDVGGYDESAGEVSCSGSV